MRLLRVLSCASAWLFCFACVLARAHAADHPLEPLSVAETQLAYELVIARFDSDPALPDEPLRFPMVALSEPDKALVLAWSRGRPFARRAEVQVLHYPSNRTWLVEVDLKRRRVVSLALTPAGTQPSATAEEFVAADALVHAHEPWKAALRRRGVDPDLAYVDIWAPGDEPLPDDVAAALPNGQNTRLLRCLTFARGAPLEAQNPVRPQNPYNRPVEGLVVTLDMNARAVAHMSDTLARPVSSESGNGGRIRRIRKLVVSEPEGSDIQLRGRLVRWHDWQFYVVLHPREGLVLYDVRIWDGAVLRPVAYRLALSEIYVPYGLGDDNWIWRSAFDVGEYNAGTLAQPLELDRDVPDNARLIDATLFSDIGPAADNPSGTIEYPATIGLYERDSGLAWTRTDPSTYDRDTRFGRELVVTWNCWIGNYIYGFDWIFKLDGSIEVKVNLTGTVLARGATALAEASAPKVGKDAAGIFVGAANHQHFLNFRLDLDVDGSANHVMEMEVANLPNTGFKNSFDAVTIDLDREGHRDVSPLTARHWHVMSEAMNALGKHTSYALEPTTFAVPYSAPDFPGLERAQFAAHQLWITRQKRGEHYAAGMFPNAAKRVDGLPVYTTPAEMVMGEDVVLWYTTGFTHVARPEDWPVMPTESIGFKLAPRGFFARNPALELEDQGALPE